ncbi:hypothetical protein VTJ83DRAFT_6883 [Remersonia thermophila]|uniref:Ig-like domain-containing protein n=1 Tax=Remersonia thermophila TaxID=72144 RepID=A0ABR4D613_9PEZI
MSLLTAPAAPIPLTTSPEAYAAGDEMNVTFQLAGEPLDSARTWYRAQDGGYVQNIHVHTGNKTLAAATCSSRDDYPPAYNPQCGAVDPRCCYNCSTNRYKDQAWGHAKERYNAAKKAGVKTSNTPKLGSIA